MVINRESSKVESNYGLDIVSVSFGGGGGGGYSSLGNHKFRVGFSLSLHCKVHHSGIS